MSEVIITCIVLGIIPAIIAASKGRNFIGWWIYGALLFIVALIHSIVIKPENKFIEKEQLNDGMKKCPFCAEMIKNDANVCRYCNREITS